MLIGCLAIAAAGLAAEPVTDAAKGKDPNEKVCETHQVLGSRLAVRRVCATRAEWAERRQRERDIVDRTQIQRCAINPSTGLCG
jgi:predicted secreted protein